MSIDLTVLDVAALEDLQCQVSAELARRWAAQTAQERAQEITAARDAELDRVAASWHEAMTGGTGTPAKPASWKRPTGPHNAWPRGAVVTIEDGRTFESLIPNNTTRPGDPDDPQAGRWWRELLAEDPDQGPAPWTLDVYYRPGDRVTHAGSVYVCTHEHQAAEGWEPDNPNMHAVWRREEP